MSLEIRQTYAKIGMDITPGRLDINTQDARLELHQNHAKINISSKLPKVGIDQYECFADAGLKNFLDLTREFAQMGRQQAMDYISKTSSDGRRLAAIHKGGNPIADIAKRDSSPVQEFGLDFIPKARPRIYLKEGDLQIEPERNGEGIHNGVEIQFTPGSAEINYMRGNVDIYLRQKASLSISYKGESVDTYL